jgi:DtxR family Mn-dependent transcriptional regulator
MVKKRTHELEEYLETLVRYKEGGKQPKVKDLARDLKISAASVSQMLKKLSKRGLVQYKRYGEIKLTPKGEKMGRTILRKHRIIEKFLALIGINHGKIHEEACVLEHAVSDDVERALRHAIWTSRKPEIKAENIKRLTDMKKGETGAVVFVTGGRHACRRLTHMGLTPGTKITVSRASSRMGPVEVLVRSSSLAIGRGLAEKVFVKVEK